MPAKKEISLLPDSENSNSLVNKALKWLTTVGRVIIIITELIVVSAFLSRFWLDRKNSDLSDTIRQQKAILETTQEFEKEYTLLAQRLNLIKNNDKSDASLDTQLSDLAASIPQEIYLDNISAVPQNEVIAVKMSAVSYQENAIVDCITNLTLNPLIKNVRVDRIEKKSKDNRYFITLSLVMTKESKK